MPYKNIHWIKLEKRLLNDYRFYSMSEEAQLIYVKFLMLATETDNKIPKNDGLIKNALRSKQTENKINECINEIKTNFPKFKENKGFYFFKEWGTRCNWIVNKELLRNSLGTPKDGIDKNRIDKNRIDKIIEEYIHNKGWEKQVQDKKILSSIYKRNCKPAKELSLLTDDLKTALNAIQWTAQICKQKKLSWTLETVISWYPEFLSQKKIIREGDTKAADPDCQICAGTGWDESKGSKNLCICRLNR